MKKATLFFFVALVFVLCKRGEVANIEKRENIEYIFNLPEWAPIPNIPDDNEMTQEKVALGKALFNDKILSRNFDLSCASCHLENLAFAQNISLPKGDEVKVGFRNSPSLINIAYQNNFFKDGGVRSLELQVLVPFETHFEFNLPIVRALERIKNDTIYNQAFKLVFGKEPDVFGLTRAIAAYQRTLIDFSTKYDLVVFEKSDSFNQMELAGFELFKANCISCHQGVNFSDQQFYNIGFDANETDLGRFRITRNAEDKGKFKTLNLRNVALTSPYMHNGSLSTLEEVLEFYSKGGDAPTKSALKPMNFTEFEKTSLKAFLSTLTSSQYVN